MKWFITIAIGLIIGGSVGLLAAKTATSDDLEIIWVGCPGVANPDDYYLNDGFLVDYTIGFRPDGIVVWKMRDPNEVKP